MHRIHSPQLGLLCATAVVSVHNDKSKDYFKGLSCTDFIRGLGGGGGWGQYVPLMPMGVLVTICKIGCNM